MNPFGKHVNYVLFSNPGTTLGLSDLFVKIRSFTNFQAIIPFSQLSKSPEDFFFRKEAFVFFWNAVIFGYSKKQGYTPYNTLTWQAGTSLFCIGHTSIQMVNDLLLCYFAGV